MASSRTGLLYFTLLVSLTGAAVIKSGLTIPTYTTPCVRDTPTFDVCLRDAIQLIIPTIAKEGIKELRVGSLEPLEVPEMVFNYDSLPDIGGKIVVTDTLASGLTALHVLRVRSSMDDMKFSMDIDFVIPKVTVRGTFNMDGRVGLFPVTGNGPYNITTGEVRGRWKLRGVVKEEEGGQRYVDLRTFGTRPSLDSFRITASNIVKGNPHLTSLVIAFTNRFWKLLYNQSLPYFERNLDTVGKRLLNKLFHNVPYSQLFPEAVNEVTPEAPTSKPSASPALVLSRGPQWTRFHNVQFLKS